jgi:hypothetical protein
VVHAGAELEHYCGDRDTSITDRRRLLKRIITGHIGKGAGARWGAGRSPAFCEDGAGCCLCATAPHALAGPRAVGSLHAAWLVPGLWPAVCPYPRVGVGWALLSSINLACPPHAHVNLTHNAPASSSSWHHNHLASPLSMLAQCTVLSPGRSGTLCPALFLIHQDNPRPSLCPPLLVRSLHPGEPQWARRDGDGSGCVPGARRALPHAHPARQGTAQGGGGSGRRAAVGDVMGGWGVRAADEEWSM